MIYVNSAAMQDEIIKLLESSDAGVAFKFMEKKGIKLAFEVDVDDDTAMTTAKSLIKESPLGKALYFQVSK